MPYGFSERSRSNLAGVHPKMRQVATRALAILSAEGGPDFVVTEGLRTKERQRELYAQGRTKPGRIVTWTLNSNHFAKADGFGRAIDLYPCPIKLDDPKLKAKLETIARAFFRAADELNIPIRWGADWDRDGRFGERGETDSPHFELWGI